MSSAQIAEKLSDLVGRKISFVNLPPEQLKQALLLAGIPDWSADALIDLQRLYREGGAATVTQEVERLLGRKPTSYSRFLSDYRSAFEQRQ